MLKVDPDSGAGVMARHLHPSFTEDYGDPPQVLASRLAPLVDDTQVEQGLHEWMATTAAGETYQPVWNAAGPAQQRAIVQQGGRVPGWRQLARHLLACRPHRSSNRCDSPWSRHIPRNLQKPPELTAIASTL